MSAFAASKLAEWLILTAMRTMLHLVPFGNPPETVPGFPESGFGPPIFPLIVSVFAIIISQA